MDNIIVISSEDGKLQAEISPEYGGMIIALRIENVNVLFLDEAKIAASPVSAGGIPLLFPFAGKTAGDRYEVDGKMYYMPMHGLVKNRTFAVKSQGVDWAELWAESDEAVLDRNYPFAYRLIIFYQITKERLLIKLNMENRSEKTLVHALGWHPYFRASNLSGVTLDHDMNIQYDYIACEDLEARRELDLTHPLDHVFCNSATGICRLRNPIEGYEAELHMDESYHSLVVYNGTQGSICIEPWCGIPNTANNRRFLEEIAPGCSRDYTWSIGLKRCSTKQSDAF